MKWKSEGEEISAVVCYFDFVDCVLFCVDCGVRMDSGDGGEVASAAAGPPTPLEWKFSQVFGERAAGEEVQEGKKW